jgi:hypothetical protein
VLFRSLGGRNDTGVHDRSTRIFRLRGLQKREDNQGRDHGLGGM